MSRRVSAAISVPIVVASFAIGTIAGIHTEEPAPSAEPRATQDAVAAPRGIAGIEPPAAAQPREADAGSNRAEKLREASAGTPPKSGSAQKPPEARALLDAVHTVPDPLFPVLIPRMDVALPLAPPAELGGDARRTPPVVAQQPRYAARYYMAPKRKAKAQGQVVETVPILGPLFSMFK